MDSCSNGRVHLRACFRFHVWGLGTLNHLLAGEREETVGVEQTGVPRLGRDAPPAIGLPFGVQGQVDSEVGLGVLLCPGGYFGKPGAGHHDARRRDPAVLQGLHGGAVLGVGDSDTERRRKTGVKRRERGTLQGPLGGIFLRKGDSKQTPPRAARPRTGQGSGKTGSAESSTTRQYGVCGQCRALAQ
jgi:hypothetical protein